MTWTLAMVWLCLGAAWAEEPGALVGVFVARTTLSPGLTAQGHRTNAVLTSCQLGLAPGVSFHGDGLYFLGEQQGGGPFVDNHSLLAGVGLHAHGWGAVDPYLSLQPGVAMTRRVGGVWQVNPVASVGVGSNLFANEWFHLFAELRGISGRDLGGPERRSLNEAKVAFGLGVNPRLWTHRSR